jgi:hypothetical protein
MLLLALSLALQAPAQSTSPVDLAGLAIIELPVGLNPFGQALNRPRIHTFDPESLERHRTDYQITFRLEQGRRALPNGTQIVPVLLNVTLFNPAKAKPDARRISFTTIPQFYPPAGSDRPRLDAHFAAQRWLDDEVNGDAVTRVAATNEGRGDSAANRPPGRWLVIHVDPTRRIRIDLYAWRSLYSVDDARSLVRRAAESLQTTPKLAELFGGVSDADARDDARFEATVRSALAALGRCGIRSMGPGMVAWSDRCASWLSEDRRFLRVARAIGRIPSSAVPKGARGEPQLAVTIPSGRSPTLAGPSDFRIAQLFWRDAANGWAIAGFGGTLHDDDTPDAPLITSITPRLHDRDGLYIVALSSYDLERAPDRVTIAEFLTESDRVATALREGTVIAGVRATTFVFE